MLASACHLGKLKNDFLCTLPILLNTKQSHATPPPPPNSYEILDYDPESPIYYQSLSHKQPILDQHPLICTTSTRQHITTHTSVVQLCESTLSGIQDLI